MIKSFIFDLDGTLLDRDSSLKGFVENQHERIKSFQLVTRDKFVNRFIELDQKGYVWKDKVYQTLIEEFNLESKWEDLLTDYIDSFQNHCIGFSNLIEILEYLKKQGIKLGIITNGPEKFQENNIRALGIEQYFDIIVISEREGIKKPDPEIFNRTLGRLKVQPNESIYVGDHPINDVRASRSVGMKSIWKEDIYYKEPFEANWIIKDLIEIKEIFESISK
jgi:putative hydrolase of the HAD superfamily